MHEIGRSIGIPGANLVKDVGDIALEVVEVAPGREVACAIDIRHGTVEAVEALHVDPPLRDLVVHLFIGDDATRLGGTLPGEVLEEHRRGLADIVVASTQEPPQRKVVLLLHICI